MAAEVDGLAILCAITETPQAFPAIRRELNKAAQLLVTKQIKARDLTLDDLRHVRAALGPQPFALVLDGMKDSEIRNLARRLDRHDPGLGTATPADHRRRLLALAAGADPVPAPAIRQRERRSRPDAASPSPETA
ncbi:hypothetical protein [Methylobacterium oryzisoli]|uniref:hypothetical protein n=1 Tax=Methylobacterium oryzisoli TaxID=3385502 RepID=UPI003892B389